MCCDADAPRFKVLAGEVLIVDNHRTWHLREPYEDLDRHAWRVWMWKEGDCPGLPAKGVAKVHPDQRRGRLEYPKLDN